MKKTKQALCLLLLVSYLGGCAFTKPAETSENITGTKANASQIDNLTYTNKKIGFSISFPESWKGKYICKGTEWGVDVQYKANHSYNVSLFSIEMNTEIQSALDETYVGLKKKIGERSPVVFSVFTPTGVPYDEKNEREKLDLTEYRKLSEDQKSVLDSFHILPIYDQETYQRFLQANKEKDDSLRADYDKLTKH